MKEMITHGITRFRTGYWITLLVLVKYAFGRHNFSKHKEVKKSYDMIIS